MFSKTFLPCVRRVAAALAGAALLTVAGAMPAHAQQKTITVTDVAERKVTLPVPVNKAVIAWSGSGGPFMTMTALLGKDVHKHIAGWDEGLARYRRDMYDNFVKSVPELAKLPVVGSPDTNDFNFEKVLSLAPDVAIFPLGMKKAVDGGIGKKLEEAGIPVVYVDYHEETVKNHTRSVLVLGQLFNKEARAKQLADLYTRKRRDVEARVAKAKAAGRPAPGVYIEVAMQGPSAFGNTYSSKFMWGGLATIAGGKVVTDSVIATAAPVDPEFLLKSNPDVIVLTGSYWPKSPESLLMGFTSKPELAQKTLSAYAKRPGWENFNAIKNKRLYAIHHGTGRELYDYVVMSALGKFFYPEEFKDVNPEAELRSYYKTYLPFDFHGTWFYQWK